MITAMAETIPLFEVEPIVEPVYTNKNLTYQEQFEIFHKTNPTVYWNLKDMALRLRARGRKKIGMSMLVEVLRWNYFMHTEDPNSDFKINNNYKSRYARKLMDENPELDNFFELRRLRTP